MWKTTGGGQPWPDAVPRLPISDHILCDETKRLDLAWAKLNAERTCPQWLDQSENKNFDLEGQLVTATRAGCADPSARRNNGIEGGWYMSVCPVPTYKNNVLLTDKGICAPRHQSFLNQTRRGTGTQANPWADG